MHTCTWSAFRKHAEYGFSAQCLAAVRPAVLSSTVTSDLPLQPLLVWESLALRRSAADQPVQPALHWALLASRPCCSCALCAASPAVRQAVAAHEARLVVVAMQSTDWAMVCNRMLTAISKGRQTTKTASSRYIECGAAVMV